MKSPEHTKANFILDTIYAVLITGVPFLLIIIFSLPILHKVCCWKRENFNNRIDRIEEITNTMNQFMISKNESSKAKAEKKKTMLKNLQKDFTSYEADYIFNEHEKVQRMEVLEMKMEEMDTKIDSILTLLRGLGPNVEAAHHQHGPDCDELYCSQPGTFHI